MIELAAKDSFTITEIGQPSNLPDTHEKGNLRKIHFTAWMTKKYPNVLGDG
jgi:hypothetical protein